MRQALLAHCSLETHFPPVGPAGVVHTKCVVSIWILSEYFAPIWSSAILAWCR